MPWKECNQMDERLRLVASTPVKYIQRQHEIISLLSRLNTPITTELFW